jgi:hypothetical protein
MCLRFGLFSLCAVFYALLSNVSCDWFRLNKLVSHWVKPFTTTFKVTRHNRRNVPCPSIKQHVVVGTPATTYANFQFETRKLLGFWRRLLAQYALLDVLPHIHRAKTGFFSSTKKQPHWHSTLPWTWLEQLSHIILELYKLRMSRLA